MSSETITRNDLTNILNEIVAIDGTDMTEQEIEDFVDSLNITKVLATAETKYLLWENTSPTSAFTSQTIPLSLDDYDEVEILYKWTTSSADIKSVRGEIGDSARAESLLVSGTSNIQFASRDFAITSSGVNVAVGNYSYTDYAQWYKYSGGAGNDLIIPLKIYGIKLVQL